MPTLTFCIAVALCGVTALTAAEKPNLPEGAGKAVTVKVCGSCHAAEILMSRRESVEGWSGVIEDMMMRGMKGSDEEYGEIVDYLVANFPKSAPLPTVNVNTADRNDLVASLGIPDPQTAAILKYRTANGPFKSIEDLLKVPGVNAKTIEAKKNRIEF